MNLVGRLTGILYFSPHRRRGLTYGHLIDVSRGAGGAWIEYLRGSRAGESVKKELEEGSEMLTNGVSVAELMSKFKRDPQIDLTSKG